ncbi:hypothetical protein R1sor_011155 [Riccia sorocarpa]|uniref:Auxin efflux carrier family protein n=1 Tax=Riccia sorocarpa TaxID=122646 RepID=A0ABD3I3J7_9MARC
MDVLQSYVGSFTEAAVGGESIATLLRFSMLPIAKVLIMCFLGFLMATSYINILPAPARKELSKLVFSLFLPCLIVTQLGKAVTIEKVLMWWFIPVNVLLGSVIGCTIGYIVALLVKPPPQFFNFTVVMIGIGNIGNIPLVLIGAICHDPNNPFGDVDKCNSDGVAYISFGQWVGAVVVYTYVYQMLAPPASLEDIGEADKTLALKEESLPYHANGVSNGNDLTAPLLLSSGKQIKALEYLKSCMKEFKVKEIITQPPVIASVLALVLGGVPYLKSQVFDEHGFLFFLSDSLNMMGGAMIPCIMLALGGNLIGGAGSSQLGMRTTVAIVFTRLCIVPLEGMAILYLSDKFGILPPNDKMFRFVMLLQHTMPTSILAGAVTNLRGFAEKEASAILFYEHIISTITLTGWLILYVNVLF